MRMSGGPTDSGCRTKSSGIRTGIALMGFGFVVARFGVFLRMLQTAPSAAPPETLIFVRGRHGSDHYRRLCERLVDGVDQRDRQARQMSRLVQQHLGLVLKGGQLVVDLLQRIGRSLQVLRVIRGVKDLDLGRA